MACYSYVFVGHVLPIAADVTIAMQNFAIETGPVDGCIRATLEITHSDITITVPRTDPIRDLATVKDRLQRMALITTAAYGFATGLGLDVEITKEIGESHPSFVFVKANAEAPRVVKPNEEMKRYWDLTTKPCSWPLRIALINYMRALREPEEAIMCCYRAIEAIGHDPQFSLSERDKNKNWKQLRCALNIDKTYFDALTNRAKDHRHGKQVIPSREEYTAALNTVCVVIQRYAAYLSSGKLNLSLDDFPPLTTSEFPTNTSATNATSRISVTSTGRRRLMESNDLLGKDTH